MPKKAILFLDQYSGLSGGQRVLLNIIQAFSKESYRCLVVLPEAGLLSQKLELYQVKSIFLPVGYYSITTKNSGDFLNYIFRLPLLIYLLIKLIKKEKIGLVYANGARTFAWATLACKITKVPLFWHVHSIFDKGIAKKSCVFFGNFSIVKKIFAVSNAVALPLSELKPKIEIVYNAVPKLSPNSNANILKKEYGLKEDDFLVGNIAVLEEWKNQEDLIRAAKLIKDAAKKAVYFFIIGDSLYKESSKQTYKNKLKSISKDMDLEKEVIFTGFRNDIDNIMQSLDVLVICSEQPDPCPLVGLEAASLAKAIISTDKGGTKEIFKENGEALFYTAGDFKTLADKLIYLFENRQIAQSLGQKANSKINREHNLGIFLKKITNAVNKAINES